MSAEERPMTFHLSGRESSLRPFDVYGEPSTTGARWLMWVEHIERFFRLDNISDAVVKRDLLLFHVGEDARRIFNSLQNTGTENEYEKARDALKDHFLPQVNPDYEDFKLRQIMQTKGESIDSFHARIREASKACEYADVEQVIRSQIIYGVHSEKLRRQIMSEPRIPLTRMLMLGRQRELADVRATAMESALRKVKLEPGEASPISPAPVAAIQRRPRGQRPKAFRTWDGDKRQGDGKPKPPCSMCGEAWHRKESCPALGRECLNCGKLNHYAVVCQSRSSPPRRENKNRKLRTKRLMRQVEAAPEEEECLSYDEEEEDEEEGEQVESANAISAVPKRVAKIRLISSVTGNKRKFRPKCTIRIENNSHMVIVDTGAAVNVISRKSFESLSPKPELNPATVILMAYGSTTPLPVLGTFLAHIRYGTNTARVRFHVVDKNTETLLGCRSAIKLRIVQFAFNVHEQSITELLEKHPKLFAGIGCLKGPPVRLHIDKTIQPVANKHRRVPFHQRAKVQKELEVLEEQNIIERVKGPTPWVSPLVVANKPKQPDKVRLCVDMRRPNVAIKRERHITPTVDDLLADLTGAKYFSKLDLKAGYHQIPLHPLSRYITTFSTHVGLRRYKRLSFGINSAAEVFQNAIRSVIQDLEGVINVSDDILVYAVSEEEHFRRLEAVLRRLEEQGLTLHREKCEYAKQELEFFGYVLNANGVSADPKKVQDIKSAARPESVSAVRSFLGMANYCGRFIPHLASVSEPLRNLTKISTKWEWSRECELAFQCIKDSLSAETTLAYFNMDLPTELLVDASPVGLGAVLTQRNRHGEVLPIAYASRALTSTEQRYSQIEREAIAVLWGCKHFHLYLYGFPFQVFTDHKPLVPIFAGTAPHPPARIEKWLLQLQVYSFDLKFRAGHDNPADFLSRHPRPATTVETAEAEETEAHVRAVIEVSKPKAISLEELIDATKQDKGLAKTMSTIKSGDWNKFLSSQHGYSPEEKQLMEQMFSVRNELSLYGEGVVLRGERIVIPETLVPKILVLAHEGHQGITKTTARLRLRYWFPRMQELVSDMVNTCLLCSASGKPSVPEPILNPPRSHTPWSHLSVDFCQVSPDHYLFVALDECSRYPEVEMVPNTSAGVVIQALEKMFATHGLPQSIRSDNGPPFRSIELKTFLGNLNIDMHHVTPYWPQANGDVERFMRTLNKVIRIAKELKQDWLSAIYRFLRSYRTTPHSSTSIAPAEALLGRRVRDTMPALPHKATSAIDHKTVEKKRNIKNAEVSLSRRAAPAHIAVGNTVLMMTRKKSGKLDLTFEASPWKVVETKGSLIVVARGNEQVCRNASLFKKISDTMWRETSAIPAQPQESDSDNDVGDEVHPTEREPLGREDPESRESRAENHTPTVTQNHGGIAVTSQRTGEAGQRYNLRRNPAPSSRIKDFYV